MERTAHFPSERLKAFGSRFRPSPESWPQRLADVALTIGLYVAVAAAAGALSILDVAQVLHALKLNGV
jgi:hypothetical protein